MEGVVRLRAGLRSIGGSRLLLSQRGQSTAEYVLLLAMISVPVSLMMLKFVQLVIRIVVTAIVGDFTEGHI